MAPLRPCLDGPTSPPGPVRHPRPQPSRQGFSLLEVVVVLVIIGLVLALALPNLGRMPRGLVISSTLSKVGIPFQDASMRARASGKPVRLTLHAEDQVFRITHPQSAASAGAGSGESPDEDADNVRDGGVLFRLRTYDVPADVEWEQVAVGSREPESEEGPTFLFFPDGAAAGEPLRFSVRGSRFALDVDRLTGRLKLSEMAEY